MSFDGIKEISNTAPPAPAKGALILEWAKRLVRWCNSERILWGAGFLVTPGPHGKAVEFIPGPGNRAFTVSRSTNATLSIQGGFAQTQTGTLTAVTAVEEVAVAANLAVFARYDLGLAGTSTPGWEVVSGSIIQTGSALPTYNARYRVIPIAAVTWDGTATAISGIVQHHTGTLPCPDMREAGLVQEWSGSVATIPHGFALMDGNNGTADISERFVLAAGSTHAPGSSGGTAGNVTGAHTHAQDAQRAGDLYLVDGTVTGTLGTYRFPDSDIPIDNAGFDLPYYALAYIQHL